MKTSFSMAVIVIAFLLSSKKEKEETNEKDCLGLAVNLAPQIVKDSFMHRYPTDSVRTWFNKDCVGYCTYFVSFEIEKLTQFSNSRIFIKEEIESNKNNEHGDGKLR